MQVDFYTFKAQTPLNIFTQKICRLIAKAYANNFNVYLLVKTDNSQFFSEELWNFEKRFLANSINQIAPIVISDKFDVNLLQEKTVFINTTNQTEIILDAKIERIFELVEPDENAKIAARERFKAYRKAQIQPKHLEN